MKKKEKCPYCGKYHNFEDIKISENRRKKIALIITFSLQGLAVVVSLIAIIVKLTN